MPGTSPGMTEVRKKRRGSRARYVEETNMHAIAIATDAAVTRSGPPTEIPATEGIRDMPTRGSDMPTPRRRARGRHLPTEMPTGMSSRQRSTFPPGIRGARMSTR